ncbi:MAG: SDR family oxidoreductase [Sulfuriferula sp.]|nr:SDR family oxidoreductase [Sulfuriferula sp.]
MPKIALVTGATGGLGQAIAHQLNDEDWLLVVTSRDQEKLTQTYGTQHLQIVADCSTYQGARDIFEATRAAGLTPTALAHCVGNVRLGALHRMSEKDFNECLSANLISAFHTLAAFIGQLREADTPGSAVLVSSAAARIGTPNHEAVSAAKAGLEGLVRGSAATAATAGIRVNAVAPGIMDSPAANKVLASANARIAAANQYPLPGIGNTKEVADLMCWLLSENAARVTGQTWAIDAGFSVIRPLVR